MQPHNSRRNQSKESHRLPERTWAVTSTNPRGSVLCPFVAEGSRSGGRHPPTVSLPPSFRWGDVPDDSRSPVHRSSNMGISGRDGIGGAPRERREGFPSFKVGLEDRAAISCSFLCSAARKYRAENCFLKNRSKNFRIFIHALPPKIERGDWGIAGSPPVEKASKVGIFEANGNFDSCSTENRNSLIPYPPRSSVFPMQCEMNIAFSLFLLRTHAH